MSERLLAAAFTPELVAAIERLVDQRVEAALVDLDRSGSRQFVTVAEAAKLTGLTERAIRAQVKKGRIRSRPLGTRLLVDMESFGS
jgi:excisionase family DNA binding protein